MSCTAVSIPDIEMSMLAGCTGGFGTCGDRATGYNGEFLTVEILSTVTGGDSWKETLKAAVCCPSSNAGMALLPELDYFPPFTWKICNKSIALLCLDGVLAFPIGNNRLSYACNATRVKLTHFPCGQVCREPTTSLTFPGLGCFRRFNICPVQCLLLIADDMLRWPRGWLFIHIPPKIP